MREAEQLRLWHDHGCVSLVEYLERALGIEPRTAIDKLRVAHRLEELPALEAMLEAGDVSYSAVREIARVATADTEDDWIAATRGKTVREVQQQLAGRARGDRPRDPIRPDELRCRVSFEVSPATKAWLAQRRRELAAERGHDFEDDDAFVRALVQANEGGTSKPTQVFLCEHEHRGWDVTHGEKAELPPAALATELCDAEIVTGDRTIKTISERRRKKLLARHGNACAVPGCRSKQHLDLHHVVHREHGGTHDDWNLVPLCAGHHRLHHEGRLRIIGRAPDRLLFEWPCPRGREVPGEPIEGRPPSVSDRAALDEILATRARLGLNDLVPEPIVERTAEESFAMVAAAIAALDRK